MFIIVLSKKKKKCLLLSVFKIINLLPTNSLTASHITSSTTNSSQDSQYWGAEMVGETAKRGHFLAALLVMLMIFLFHPNNCGTAMSLESNATSIFDGPMDEPEFMFESEISRMLIDYKHVTDASSSGGGALCSRRPYKTCLPQSNGKRVGETCNDYKRRGC